LRLGTLVPINIEVPMEYLLSQDKIVVFEICLHRKSPMLYRPALHGNWNALSFARRALKDKFSTPTVPLTVVLPNRQVFLLDLYIGIKVFFSNTFSWNTIFFTHNYMKKTAISFPTFVIQKTTRAQHNYVHIYFYKILPKSDSYFHHMGINLFILPGKVCVLLREFSECSRLLNNIL
jgi:hypothetical protein